jgi:type II secretory pathway component PulC
MLSRSLEISVTAVVIATSTMLVGCGRPSEVRATQQAPSIEETAQSSGSSATAAQTARATPTQLTRALIEETVREGLGAFLSRVEVTPVVNGRRFVGFRLESAEDLASWRAAGADLRVGDVVQQINGQTIERPEQALWAFEQLRIARGIEVVGVRGSAPFRVYSPIVDSQ